MNEHSIDIKRAGQNDAGDISTLGRDTFIESFGKLFAKYPETLANYLDRTFAIEKLVRSLDNADSKYWIACAGDGAVGYAKLKLHSKHPFCTEDPVAQLQKIYLRNDRIGIGIGHALAKNVTDEAYASGAKQLWLSVHEHNTRALRFYERLGWCDRGPDKFTVGELVLGYRIMTLDIS